MKRSIKSILMAVVSGLVLAFTLASCDLTPSVSLYAKELDKDCPKDLGDGLVVKHVDVSDNYLVMHAEVDEESSIMALVLMDEFGEEFTKEFTKSFLEEEGMEEVYKACKKENKGIKIVVKGDKSGKTADLVNITPEEIQKMNL